MTTAADIEREHLAHRVAICDRLHGATVDQLDAVIGDRYLLARAVLDADAAHRAWSADRNPSTAAEARTKKSAMLAHAARVCSR